jgi:hypothetical protein
MEKEKKKEADDGDIFLMAIDPGLKNTAAAVIKLCISKIHAPELVWSYIYDLSSTSSENDNFNPAVFAALLMSNDLRAVAQQYHVSVILVEYQPPITVSHMNCLIRWNAWIEGFVISALAQLAIPCHREDPAAVKRFFEISEKLYHKRKRACVLKARVLIPSLTEVALTDHVADCILMCFHYYFTQIHYDHKI